MKGTKANARARMVRGVRNDRDYEAPWMKKPVTERHEAHQRQAECPLEQETDPRGLPYYIATGGAAMPCYVRPSLGKKE